MKGKLLTQICAVLICLLFVYTSASKFLDSDKFIFQMRLAPVPLMQWAAPILGWLVPTIEMLIAIGFAIGLFKPSFQLKALYAAVILLFVFEVYITIMLLSGLKLPCTCGGIISRMSWKQHLFFNGFFIITGLMSIRYLTKHKTPLPNEQGRNGIKILSRA